MTPIKQPRTGRVVWAGPKRVLLDQMRVGVGFSFLVNALGDDSDISSGVNFKVDKRVI